MTDSQKQAQQTLEALLNEVSTLAEQYAREDELLYTPEQLQDAESILAEITSKPSKVGTVIGLVRQNLVHYTMLALVFAVIVATAL